MNGGSRLRVSTDVGRITRPDPNAGYAAAVFEHARRSHRKNRGTPDVRRPSYRSNEFGRRLRGTAHQHKLGQES